MSDLIAVVVFVILIVVIAAAGIRIGMIVARRMDRHDQPPDGARDGAARMPAGSDQEELP